MFFRPKGLAREGEPNPLLDESPPAEPARYRHGSMRVVLNRILAVVVSVAVGSFFGPFGVLAVSAVCAFLFFRSLYHVLQGGLGEDGLIFILEMETIPTTLFILFPAWLGYAAAALLQYH